VSLRRRRAHWLGADGLMSIVVRAFGLIVVLVLVGMAVFLVHQGWSSIRHYGFGSFIGSTRWAPSEAVANKTHPNPFGIVAFIYGTLLTSLIAMVLAVPIAVTVALFITDIAPRRLRTALSYLVDLLAAIPSVVYGFWGIFALEPALRPVANGISNSLGKVPGIGPVFAGPYFGPSYFAAGVVLAIMILPIITAICREVFAVAPAAEKEAALALGATRWEMLRMAVLPRSRSGIAGAAILGLGRAIGETIAVTMLIGNSVLGITKSVFGQGATLASVIANEFTEATEPFHLASLFVVGLWLLILSFVVNAIGKLIVGRVSKEIA
jgi:phosphate transport system permease protein